MKFKPFGKKYIFQKDVLIDIFPDYMIPSLQKWIIDVLRSVGVIEKPVYGDAWITSEFLHKVHILFRELFPKGLNEFLQFTLDSKERTSNIIAYFLQNYVYRDEADRLEFILSQGGSAYEVTIADKNASEYSRGIYDLVVRVPSVIKELSKEALSNNEILAESWNHCYSRNPDYEKVVSRCSDFLEGLFKEKYFPKDPKPQLKKFVHSLEADPSKLRFKGDSIVNPKSLLTSLLKEVSDIRGQHTQGKGRVPTKEESEFVLHTTILIWNLHNGIT